jgi:hypothetical protein
MRVLVNCSLICPTKLRGMGTFKLEILRRLIREDKATHSFILATNTRISYQLLKSEFADRPEVKIHYVASPEIIFEQIIIPILSIFRHANAVIHGGDTAAILCCWANKKNILLLHDVHYTYEVPYELPIVKKLARIYRRVCVRSGVYQASAIITVSRFACDEIKIAYPLVCSDKIYVACNGPSLVDQSIDVRVKENVLLLVTGPDPQKNLKFFLESLISQSSLLMMLESVWVVGVEAPIQIGLEPHPKINFVGYVEAAKMSDLYKVAGFLAVPSLLESFGIPALDGLRYQCRILSSDTGALPEVLGHHAIYFSPTDSNSICRALEECQRLGIVHYTESEEQRAHSEQYSWEIAAAVVLEAIESVDD